MFVRGLIFPGCETPLPSRDELRAREIELVSYPTSDGLELEGAFVRSKAPGSRTAVLFHGNKDSAVTNLPFAVELAKHGIDTFLAEYRGYGGMPGVPSERGLYLDGEASLDALEALGVPKARPILIGRSLGSGVAVELAHRGYGSALVLISPYTSVVDVASRRVGFLARLLVSDRFESAKKIGSIARPIVILHGTMDPVIPFEHAKRLVALSPGAKLVALEGQGHRLELASLAGPIV